MTRFSVIIPVYEEASTCATLLERVCALDLPDGLEKEIIVIESRSKDGSREIVQAFERDGRIRALYQDRPSGKGNAVKEGLAATTGDILLIQDADLEYDVADYAKLLRPLLEGRTSFVLGSRHLGRESWAYRTPETGWWSATWINAGVWVLTQLFNLLYGVRLTDPCTMYKVFRRECLEGVHWQSDGFELDWEIVAKFVRKGRRPVELPIWYRSRTFEAGKKVRFWRDGCRAVWAICRFRWGPL